MENQMQVIPSHSSVSLKTTNQNAMQVNNVVIPYPDAPIPKLQYQNLSAFDMDAMLKHLAQGIPIIDEEVMYKNECDVQSRIYLALFIIGLMMVTLVILW